MKFYLCYHDDEVVNCFFTLKDAKTEIINLGCGYVQMVEVDVTAESMRRVLHGYGYAKNQKVAFQLEAKNVTA